MQVLRRVATGAPNDDRRAFLVPLEDGTWPDTKPPPDFGWNRNLPLRRQTRLSKCHV